MNISGFRVEADLLGMRMRASWRFDLSSGENLAGIPRVQIARKDFDYEFPAPQAPDPFVIYDSGNFPFPGQVVQTITSREWPLAEGGRKSQEVDSVSMAGIEVLRRSTRIFTDSGGAPKRVEVEILDARADLAPLTTYYYELRPPDWNTITDRRNWRSQATTTGRYKLGRTMYQLLPEMYRRHDVVRRPPNLALTSIPEAEDSGGQLRRLLELMGSTLDYLRSRAEGLLNLHDLRTVDSRLLPLLASWIGWDLSFDAPIPIQRHEVRYAAALYRITGTIPGCMIWAQQLTRWPARIKEFYRNVFFTNNDVGDKDDPKHKGSRTVDTTDAALVSALGGFDDAVQYTYDTGTTQKDFYAYNVIGIFVQPGATESVETVNRKLERLRTSFNLFLPVNIRGVVVVEIQPQPDIQTGTGNLINKIAESAT